MDPELEALLKAFDAANQARGTEFHRLNAIYESRLDDVCQRFPNLSPGSG